MITIIETFAGVGSQRKALDRLGLEHKGYISEWEINAIISYDAIHTDDGSDPSEFFTKSEILEDLQAFTFSSDGKLPCDISRLPEARLRQLYNAHTRSNNLGSILDIKSLPTCDLLTYSFPCQDISVAGKGAGLSKDSGTRSGLLWEVERLLLDYNSRKALPKYLLMENVKNLVGKQHKPDFDKWLESLDKLGYKTYWKVLNAKDLGVPQNRERVFAISVLKKHDIFRNKFPWPAAFDNGLRLKDFLENEVDEKYYISGEKADKLILSLGAKIEEPTGIDLTVNHLKFREVANCISARQDRGISNLKQEGTGVLVKEATKQGYAIAYEGDSINLEQPNSKTRRGRVGRGVAQTLTTSCDQAVLACLTPDRVEKRQNGRRFKDNGEPMFTLTGQDIHGVLLKEPKIIELAKMNPNRHSSVMNSVVSPEGIIACLDTMGGGNREPKILEGNLKQTRLETETTEIVLNECKRLGGIFDSDTSKHQAGAVWDKDGFSPTLDTMQGGYRQPSTLLDNYRIRKLTPKECWRLMGFDDEDFERAERVNSNSQLYKQAGNSIVVDVLEYQFEIMFEQELLIQQYDILA
jgi:DNA (cytosine-5)-methyltransferase 1